MGVKANAGDIALGRLNSSGRNAYIRFFVNGETVDSSDDREMIRNLLIAIGPTSPLGKAISTKFKIWL